MNNERKEILDRLFVYKNENDEMKYQPEDILTIDDVWLLLDYITNLQEENKELNDDNIWWSNRYNAIVKQNDDNHKKLVKEQEENKKLKAKLELYENGVYFSSENDELQERIDKAIEFVERKQEDINNGGNDMSYIQMTQLLEILKGDSSND